MELNALMPGISTPIASSSNSWLITPNVGLTIWTLVVFLISLYILNKVVFPRIRDALDRRRASIDESIDAAERTRQEADKLLADYRARLHAAREQAEEIVQRARQAAESHEHEGPRARPGDDRRRDSSGPSATSRPRPNERSTTSAARSPT